MQTLPTPPDCGISARDVTFHDAGHCDSANISSDPRRPRKSRDKVYLVLAQFGPLTSESLSRRTKLTPKQVLDCLRYHPFEKVDGKWRIKEGF